MDKYVGQYRVDIERDIYGKPMEFTYIRGSGNYKECKIYRYNGDKLRLYATNGRNVDISLTEAGINATVVLKASREWVFEFGESDIETVAKLIKARAKGCAIKPQSKRNKKTITN